MADAVTTRVIADGQRQYVIHLTCISDGTGETAVIKADKSTLKSAVGIEPVRLDIEQIRWAMQGFTSIRILWDHTTDDTALVLSGNGYDDFRGMNGAIDGVMQSSNLKDPASAGGTGDILLTSSGAADGSTYDITLWLRKAV